MTTDNLLVWATDPTACNSFYPHWRYYSYVMTSDEPREYRIAEHADGSFHLLMLTNNSYANSQNFRTLGNAKRTAEEWELEIINGQTV